MDSDAYGSLESSSYLASWCYDAAMVKRADLPDPEQRHDAIAACATRVDAEGRVTIPQELREGLGWGPGTPLAVTLEADGTLRLAAAPAAVRETQDEQSEAAWRESWHAALRDSHGIWRDREDLPDSTELRSDWDRERERKS